MPTLFFFLPRHNKETKNMQRKSKSNLSLTCYNLTLSRLPSGEAFLLPSPPAKDILDVRAAFWTQITLPRHRLSVQSPSPGTQTCIWNFPFVPPSPSSVSSLPFKNVLWSWLMKCVREEMGANQLGSERHFSVCACGLAKCRYLFEIWRPKSQVWFLNMIPRWISFFLFWSTTLCSIVVSNFAAG